MTNVNDGDYQKLVGTGKQGDFVLNSQTVASEQGFRNVSKIWFDKTLTYEQGLELLEKDIAQRKDILCSLGKMAPTVTDEGKFVLAYEDGSEYMLDEWSATQYATRLEMPVTVINWLTTDKTKPDGKLKYARDEFDARILQACVKNAMRRIAKDKSFRFRVYGDRIRAVLTEDYAPIDNRWYLNVLKEFIPGGRLSHWRGDADTLYGNILIPDSIRQESDSEYGGMISIGNCEIGKRRLSQYPSVFRAICMNGCIWDRTNGKNLNKVHKGKLDLNDLRKAIGRNIQEQIPLTVECLKDLLRVRKYEIKDIPKFVAEIATGWKMNAPEAREVLTQWNKWEKTSPNLFGVVNAITRAGQTLPAKRWVEFDAVAGELIGCEDNTFQRINRRAENLSDEFVAEAFGLAV